MGNGVKITTSAETIPNNILKVYKEYVSRDDLRAMAVGQELIFVVPNDKLESARSTCNAMRFQRMKFGCKLRVHNNESMAIVKRKK